MKKTLLSALLLSSAVALQSKEATKKDAMDIINDFFDDNQSSQVQQSYDFHEAAKIGDYQKLQYLLEQNHNGGNLLDLEGKTPLHIAVENRQCECVTLLCDYKYNTNTNKKDLISGWAALHIAAYLQNVECMKILCSRGANPNIQEDITYQTPLHIAALQKNQTCIDILCRTQGIIVNAADADGLTPLHIAARSGNINIMKQLLYYSGAHYLSYIVQRDHNGKTAYDHAASNGYQEAARMLKQLEEISMEELKRVTLK